MARTSRWVSIAVVGGMVLALSSGPAAAADRTKVDRATRQVDHGARQIGQGRVGPGFKQMFVGIGHTIVEGAKYSGNTMGEFFRKAF